VDQITNSAKKMKVLIPHLPERPGGSFVTVNNDHFEVLAARDKIVIIEFHSLPEGIDWFDTFELLYCQRQHDPETIKVIRKATDDEWRLFRIPLWIQENEVPKCCGQPMYFVGQLDDDRICRERPEGAKLWWHDVASFYVFTCSQCLQCNAVGQQF
jgi:hypothetical protein